MEAKEYKKVAIYGMSYVGENLIEEIKETNVEAVYGIDNINSLGQIMRRCFKYIMLTISLKRTKSRKRL